MKRFILVCALLAACSSADAPAEDAADDISDDATDAAEAVALSTCKGDAFSDAIGKPVSDIQAQLPDSTRVVGPDSLVTQDYRPTRLNVAIDADGLITRVSCG